jgi:hypothetical protein
MKLNLRRIVLATIAGIILLAIATSPFTSMFVVRRLASEIVNDSLTGLTLSSEITLNISDGFLETSLAMNSLSGVERRIYVQRIEKKTANTDARLKAYEKEISNAHERLAFDQLVSSRREYRAVRDEILKLLDREERGKAEELFRGRCTPLFNTYLQAVERLVNFNIHDSTERGAHIVRVANNFLIVQGLLLVFFCVYAFFVPALTFYERMSRRSLED